VSESLPLKETIFRNLAAELPPTTILASNTSSISITKIAAATIPEGQSASSKEGQRSTGRVVGMFRKSCALLSPDHGLIGLHFFNPVPVMVRARSWSHALELSPLLAL
jgi:3-hydroxybutyryl-CoA dehydrogenase